MSAKFPCLDSELRETLSQDSLSKDYDISLNTVITHGHGVASKASQNYPQGTIPLQYPFFKSLGLDLSLCYPGTLNLSISPLSYNIHKPLFHLKNVNWYPQRGSSEDFKICSCAISLDSGFILGYIYQPDIATKIEHYDDPQALQIISPFIPNLKEGDRIKLHLKSSEIELIGKIPRKEYNQQA